MTDVAFRNFGHIVRMDGNSFQFYSIMFYSILELENTIAPVYLRTSTEILDPGLTYYREGYITKHRVVIVVRPNM